MGWVEFAKTEEGAAQMAAFIASAVKINPNILVQVNNNRGHWAVLLSE